MAKKLENKVAVITGATSGLALATAKLFVEEGAYVFITGRRQKQLDDAIKSIGHNVTGVRADSGKIEDLTHLFEVVAAEKGKIDILYVSSGIGQLAEPIGTISEDSYNKTFDVNVKGTLFTVQLALPIINDGGSIIMTGSMASIKGYPGAGVYASSKAAIRSFARTWTSELKDRKIRVNTLSPGPTDTNVFEGMPPEVKDGLKSLIPMGRLAESEEIAKSALFLASNDSSFITGIELFVDGGAVQI